MNNLLQKTLRPNYKPIKPVQSANNDKKERGFRPKIKPPKPLKNEESNSNKKKKNNDK